MSRIQMSFSSSSDEDFYELVEVALPRRRIIRERVNHFQKWDDDEFFVRFRLPKEGMSFVLDIVENFLVFQTERNDATSPALQLLTTMRYYATGSLFAAAGDFSGISKATASRCIWRVTKALARLRPDFVKFPDTPEGWQNVRQGFYEIAAFPKCVGAIDCAHVKIQSPGGPEAELYRNRKGYFSINVQTVCDSDLKIQNIVARWHGSAHDSAILLNSRLRTRFESGEMGGGVLVGDSGYALSPYLMTKIENPTNEAEILYNESLIRTRNTVERSYGVWKRRFPILSQGINLNPEKSEGIIVATAVLHNMAVQLRIGEPAESQDPVVEETFPPSPPPQNTRRLRPNYRAPFVNYFRALSLRTVQ